PVFRDYVIDYLSNLDETLAERIPASDLILSVRKGRFYLRSKRFDKEVIPRLTCAHNYSLSPIPMYRFLADMQSLQRTQGFGFAVGSLFSTLDYMPRIRYKNIVLSRRRWKLNYDDVKAFSAYRTEEHRKAYAGYMAERRLPRRVVHPMGDNELLLDLHDDRCVRLLFSLLRKYKTVSVEEFLFDTEHAVVHDEQANGYTNEMIVILHK
ncbi:lantibiotic dehydratase, partial [Alistipes putredinis]|uniref:lantibiotic dehydratase n=1 Tax=Alistipes putredinis TaxID=28117 RepID=UPI003A8A98D3